MSETRATFKERQIKKKQDAAREAEAALNLSKKSLSTAERALRDAKRYANGTYVEKYMPDATEDEIRGAGIARKEPRTRERWDRDGREARLREEKEAALAPVRVFITLPEGYQQAAEVMLRLAKFKRMGTSRAWVGTIAIADANFLASQCGGTAKVFNDADETPTLPLAAE